MKKLITICALVVALGSMSFAQNKWNFAGYFPDSTFVKKATGIHGLAVDPANKLWASWYGTTDSIDTGGGVFAKTIAIYVFNANGTQAAFSPLKVLVGAGVRDTLFSTGAAAVTNRGLKRDHQGNILASIFDRVYRLNYTTGAVMNKVASGAGNSIAAAAADSLGEIFVQTVVGGNPIKIWGSDFSSLGNVTDTSRGFCRTGEVSKNGNDYYSANYTLHAIYRYHSDNGSFGPYVVRSNDTLMKGFDCESMVWHPTRASRLWASAGSQADAPNRYPGVTTNYGVNRWYEFNTTNFTITDSLIWKFYNTDSANTKPRAIAFSTDGLTAYVGCFGAATYPSVEKFTFGPSSVERDLNVIPVAFTLSQNYPNPFNPSTEIKFTLTKSGMTTLKVYNALGQEVATLVNESLNVGGYTTHFDATNLASGTYIYRLTANGQTMSKKMVLMK